MNKGNLEQGQLFGFYECPHEEILNVSEPLYYINEQTGVGNLSQLALKCGDWQFKASQCDHNLYTLTHESGLSFRAKLKKGKGKEIGTYSIENCVININEKSFFEKVNIYGVGDDGSKLRDAQRGAIYSLLSHWSLKKDVATVVLPTGTGKTETMLLTTLIDYANRTLVIVPSIELKEQIAEKFKSWGILEKLKVIPENTTNPKVLVLDKTLIDISAIDTLKRADVVVSTPALIARASQRVKKEIKDIFSHIYFDEAHHIVANEWNDLKVLFRNSKIVQFTATPYRNDRKPIEGTVVYNYPLSKALDDNCFSKISLVTIDERHPKKKDKAIADAAMARLLEDRQKGYINHRMMVRAKSKSYAEKLYHDYSKWFPNERIILVHSKTNGNKETIKRIKNDEYDIIVCVDMLKEGFDYPNLKIAAVHGIHKSLSVLLQFIGRFTRAGEEASFIVNYAEEDISIELENLLQEGSGWEKVIQEVADAKKNEAESFLSFLQGCQPYSSFDSPNIELNPKLVYPALSCVCYKCKKVYWKNFKEAFDIKKYALSQPYINEAENVFYFTTQKREKVKWARTNKMKHQEWNLVVMHHDEDNELLFVGSSEKRLDLNDLVEKISGFELLPIKGDSVFRSFDSIKRLSIVHAGIFKPANHLHRYSRLSGADVTIELEKWKNGERCAKSDFVGIGFRDGFPVSIGASVKGKIWSPARVGDLKQWKEWCLQIGRMITNETIDSNFLLENSAKKTDLTSCWPDDVTYPDDVTVLAVDWADSLYNQIHKITLDFPDGKSFLLSEATLRHIKLNGNRADFTLSILEEVIPFSIVLGGEKGHIVEGLQDTRIKIDGLKAKSISLEQFFQENPPTMFLLNGCTISGCIHTDYGKCDILIMPDDCIKALSWKDVNYTVESYYKKNNFRENSIQVYMMKRLVKLGAKIVFNDDNAGESADIVAIFMEKDLIRFELIHCKFSKGESGARLSDLYEVCGQAIVSLRYKWNPEDFIKHMARRNATGVLNGKRFYYGNTEKLEEIRKALRYSDVKFEFAIAQPGVVASELTDDMKRFLGSVYSTVTEMTETKLRCYFNEK